MEENRPKVGIGVVVVRDGKVLLGERIGGHGSGGYQLPGGHLEYGETFEEAGRREVAEETGLTDLTFKGVVSLSSDVIEGKHYVTIGLLAESLKGEPVALEKDKARNFAFVETDSLPENLFLPSRRVLEHWLSGTFYTG